MLFKIVVLCSHVGMCFLMRHYINEILELENSRNWPWKYPVIRKYSANKILEIINKLTYITVQQ